MKLYDRAVFVGLSLSCLCGNQIRKYVVPVKRHNMAAIDGCGVYASVELCGKSSWQHHHHLSISLSLQCLKTVLIVNGQLVCGAGLKNIRRGTSFVLEHV
jgi:hypothetical protein